MSEGFGDVFDAYAAAASRDDGVVVGAFAEPTVRFLPDRTEVFATHGDLRPALADARQRLADRGVRELEWLSLEARPLGSGLHHVTVVWAHDESAPRIYLLRGDPPDTVIIGVVSADASF